MKKTYQTKIAKNRIYPTNDIVTAYLNEYAEYFQMIERSLYVDIVFRHKSIATIKKAYLTKYNITARQFNSIKSQIQGKISAIKELKKLELVDKTERIKKIKESIEELEKLKVEQLAKLSSLKMNDKNFFSTLKEYKKIKFKLHQAKRKHERVDFKKCKVQVDLEMDIARICFGSKELFRKQFNLRGNNYLSHIQWLSDWKEARSNQCMFIGSSDESFGNQNCQYNHKNEMLIRVADRFVGRYGKYIKISNVNFKYGQKVIDYSKQTVMKYSKGGDYKEYCKGPITHRFNKNQFGWYLNTTVDENSVTTPKCIVDSRIGAMGVDFNENFISVGYIDRFGNVCGESRLNYYMYGKSSNQIEARLSDISKELCHLSTFYKVPIIIEDLDFKKAKRSTDKSAKYNRMIGSFPYAKFKEILINRSTKVGTYVTTVSPAYTSIIGQFKFMRKYGLSSHGSAAVTIARRGIGLKFEKIDKSKKDTLLKLKCIKTVNIDNYTAWKEFSKLIKENIKFNDRIDMLYKGII